MGRLGIGDRLNTNSKQGVIFTDEYRKVRLDPRTKNGAVIGIAKNGEKLGVKPEEFEKIADWHLVEENNECRRDKT